MRKVLLWLGVVVGVLEILGTAYWVVTAIAWGALTSEIANASVFLVTGPLLILPASILAFRAPGMAGMLLILGGLFSAVWHILVTQSPHGMEQLFRSEPAFECWFPLTVVSLPMVILGAAVLCSPDAPDAPSAEARK